MIVYIQRTDTTFDSVDFDDPRSIIYYFIKLFQSRTGVSEEEAHGTIIGLIKRIFDKETNDDSKNSPGVEALLIMTWTAKHIHGAFQELSPDRHSTMKTAELVLLTMDFALDRLIELALPKSASQPELDAGVSKDNENLASG